jgi:hypothetical protein
MIYIEDAFKKIQKCHDGHGRWCASTFKVGCEALIETGMEPKWAKGTMEKFHEYCKEKTGRWGDIVEEEKRLDEITVQQFCDATVVVNLSN